MTYVCLCGNGVEFRERVYVAAVLAHRSRRCGRWAPRCGCQFPRSVPPSSSCQDRLRGPHRARHIPASSTSHMRNQCGAVHMLRPSSALPSSPCRLRSEALPPPSYHLPGSMSRAPPPLLLPSPRWASWLRSHTPLASCCAARSATSCRGSSRSRRYASGTRCTTTRSERPGRGGGGGEGPPTVHVTTTRVLPTGCSSPMP